MPSPFPGMNPFLEQDSVWQDFHLAFLPALRERIVPQVVPGYIVVLEEHLYVQEHDDAPRRLFGRADVGVASMGGGGPRERPEDAPAIGLIEPPARVELVAEEVERVPYLEIRDRRGRELITVVELLSPTNKRAGPGREPYLSKRREILAGPVHLVEIDLLRGGRPLPLVERPPCDYSALVSRAEERRRAGFWPIGLRERLPVLPIPLRHPGEHAIVDLQEALHGVFDASGYVHYLYETPPEPPLPADDLAWALATIEMPTD